MAQTKTPGVYINEINAFSNSVVEVATAVPAFIGYTEKAMRGNQVLTNIPTRISSIGEFHDMFGYGPANLDSGPTTKYDYTPHTTDSGFDLKPVANSQFYLYSSMRLFFDNGGGPCYIISVGNYKSASKSKDALTALPLAALLKEQEPTMVVVPDAVLLDADGWLGVAQLVLAHCGKMQSRVAILDVFNGNQKRTNDANDVISGTKGFRALTSDFLKYGAAYYPWINTGILEDSSVDYSQLSDSGRTALVTALNAEAALNYPPLDPAVPGTPNPKLAPLQTVIKVVTPAAPAAAPAGGDGTAAPAQESAADAKTRKATHQTLFTVSPLYKQVMMELKKQLNMLPPSGAMAGVYTRTDNNLGVFKAPANTGIVSAISPTVNINQDEQEDLNVPLDGKAVNAIRTFIGQGMLIWGARTLDGNSQDWRYINVRRTMIMLEQSIKIATQAYVFAPNTDLTWVTIKNMITNFLTNQWKSGALAGAKPEDAFSVDVGLGSTMTGDDILDGYMRVMVKVAVVRPAEFIIITFQQKMQTS
jgi:phage tail sheath protein FI